MKLGTTGVLFPVMSLASGKHKMLINIYRMNGRKKKGPSKYPVGTVWAMSMKRLCI